MVLRRVRPIDAVQKPRRAGARFVHSLDVGQGLVPRQSGLGHGGVDPILQVRRHPHAEHVIQAGKQQVADVPMIDQVVITNLIQEHGREALDVGQSFSRHLLPKPRGFIQRLRSSSSTMP